MQVPDGMPSTLVFADCVGVFQGGGCRAAAHAGAFAAAHERGVHFHEVAGASAGAIVAVLIAAGAEPEWLDNELRSLDFRTFMGGPDGKPRYTALRPLKYLTWGPVRYALDLVNYQGLHSGSPIERWVEEKLRILLPDGANPSITFADLLMPASVIAADLREGKAVQYGTRTTPGRSVAAAVRASCSMPFFFQPHDGQVDGGVLSNLPSHLVSQEDEPSSILAFVLEDDSGRNDPEDIKEFSMSLADTIVRGAQELQAQLQSEVHVIRISTGRIKATDFATITPEQVQQLSLAGYEKTRAFFDRENLASPRTPPETRTQHNAQTLNILAREMLGAQDCIYIAEEHTRWIFELFPALVLALMRNVRVRILLSGRQRATESATYRRRLLDSLGCEVVEEPDPDAIPIRAFLFDPDSPRGSAVIFSTGGEIDATVHRQSAGESGVLSLVSSVFGSYSSAEPTARVGPPLQITAAAADDVYRALIPVNQYSDGAQISVERVPLRQVNSWAKYAHSYKQRQQEAMVRLFRESGLEPFQPAFLQMAEGRKSLMMPPVVEASPSGSIFTIVNGASRLLLLHRQGAGDAQCAVVRGVGSPPASQVHQLDRIPVRMGRRGLPEHRYVEFQPANVRHVEKFAHSLESLDLPAEPGEER